MQDAEYRQCERCSVPLTLGKRFCSKACWRAFEAERAPADKRPCQQCGEPLKNRGTKAKFCSRECAGIASRGRTLPPEQRAKIAESNRRTKAAQGKAGIKRKPPRPRPVTSGGACESCGEHFPKRIKGMCQPCYSKARYNANREHMLEVGRRWRERNPDYFKQPKLTARAAANFRERYYGGLYEAALERDASTCQHCGLVSKPGRGRNGLHVHHVDGDNTNNVLENLQVLCCPCHAREHRRRGDFAPAA